MKDFYFKPDLPQPSHERRSIFAARIKDTLSSFAASEQDINQQQANREMSGPGRTHYDPADRPAYPHPISDCLSSGERQSRYTPPAAETILSACRTAIEIHQMQYNTDPQQIRISYSMYFELSSASSVHNKLFQGKLSFIGISNTVCYVDVRVYSDTSTNVVICIH